MIDHAVVVSLFAGASIGLGGALGSLVRDRRAAAIASALGFSAGAVMGIHALKAWPVALGAAGYGWSAVGFAGGIGIMALLHRVLVHRRSPSHAATVQQRWLNAGLLALSGIALHNIMDGLGIGAGFAHEAKLGWLMAAAVLLHNLPVGMLIGVPLCLAHVPTARIVGYTLLAGLFTPLGAGLGMIAGLGSPLGMALGLVLASGSLFYVIGRELLPMALAKDRLGTAAGIALGLIAAAVLEAWL
jgi:ZIP family zinc transporter